MTGAHTLDRMADHARHVQGVGTEDVHCGDWVVVRTRNSTYSMAALDDGRFLVAGGWFAAHGAESEPVGVLGCTWGGRAILTGVLAAPGMFIEFDNGVHTTRILEVRLIRGANPASRH
jgi:hypothetical protein